MSRKRQKPTQFTPIPRYFCELIGGPADGLVSEFEPRDVIEVYVNGPMRPPAKYRWVSCINNGMSDPTYRYRYEYPGSKPKAGE